ncbi:toxin-antitoxin system, toxin component family protein [Streptomyces yokosukanensis]|uniref:toxin-antitoxin system, toxin component family protein n=1 Tax=Streptomyces yokosukanensis TaxID=67386 RepID=UPI00099E7368|nr:toxin-antitoxin system, toxin component family protein [Streptomyces yokosukanensis]
MGIAGARERAARLTARLRRSRPGSAMRSLAGDLAAAVRTRPSAPDGVREVCRVLCEEMTRLRGGRPVRLRFERFPDEIEVTGLWVEFADFDLVIVEERAEAVQQLVILGHELWHLHAGHRHHHLAGDAAARALADTPGWRDTPLTVAARNGSREADEAEADDFGHRLAALFRHRLADSGAGAGASLGPVQRTLGYRGREQADEPKGRAPKAEGAARERGTTP